MKNQIKSEELNEIAKKYHLNDNIQDKFIENICQNYCCNWLEKLIKNDAMNVLELGYGEGIISNRLSQRTKNYYILEGSDYLISTIKEKHPNINIINTLFEEYVSEKKYDRIFALHVFEHIDDSIFLAKYMKSWLKNDGEMIVIVPNKESMHRRLALQMGLISKLDELSKRDYLVGHKKVYSLETLRRDFIEAGYDILEEKGFFLKSVPNSMMLDYSNELIYALNICAESIPVEFTANIAIRVRIKE